MTSQNLGNSWGPQLEEMNCVVCELKIPICYLRWHLRKCLFDQSTMLCNFATQFVRNVQELRETSCNNILIEFQYRRRNICNIAIELK